MNKNTRRRRFLANQDAVSEEFTALPTLSIVMIGFTLFIVLLANTYSAYHDRMDQLEIYQTADLVATKLIDPNLCFIQKGGVIDLPPIIESTTCRDDINQTRLEYQQSGLDFTITLSAHQYTHTFPTIAPTDRDRVAVTPDVSVLLNDAETVPGKLTVIMWNV